ncbi:START domain-containing protein [Elusimicrobiota bacterium]
MARISALLFASILLIPVARPASAEWKRILGAADDDIRVYSRKSETGYTEYKGVTSVESPLGALIAVFRDVDAIPLWFDKTKEVKVVKTVSDTEYYVYTTLAAPFPIKDRDSVVRTVISQDPKTLVVTVTGTSVPDLVPEDEDHVRVRIIESSWTLIPKGDGLVEVAFQCYSDPGGKIPAWLLKVAGKTILKRSPYKTLKRLKRLVGREKYRGKTFPYIKEPPDQRPPPDPSLPLPSK